METCSGVEKAADECWRSTPSTVSLFIRLLETARRASLTIELRADKKYSGGGRGGCRRIIRCPRFFFERSNSAPRFFTRCLGDVSLVPANEITRWRFCIFPYASGILLFIAKRHSCTLACNICAAFDRANGWQRLPSRLPRLFAGDSSSNQAIYSLHWGPLDFIALIRSSRDCFVPARSRTSRPTVLIIVKSLLARTCASVHENIKSR